MGNTIVILDPTARRVDRKISGVKRTHDLNGKVIGFLWNKKPNGDTFLQRTEEHLTNRFDLKGTRWYELPTDAGSSERSSALNKLARSSDIVINAMADWGSCTTWCIHGSIELEKRGTPTVTLCTDRFETLARITAKSLGMPDLPMVVILHPIGGLGPEVVREKADEMIEKIIARMIS